MELPFISGILKRYRKKKQIKFFRSEMQRIRDKATEHKILFNEITETFYCPTCGQRICGRNSCKSIIPAIVHLQQEYDFFKEQIVVIEKRFTLGLST